MPVAFVHFSYKVHTVSVLWGMPVTMSHFLKYPTYLNEIWYYLSILNVDTFHIDPTLRKAQLVRTLFQ